MKNLGLGPSVKLVLPIIDAILAVNCLSFLTASILKYAITFQRQH